VASNLTIGGGLSSSAAFEVAVALALGAAAGWSVDADDLATACQRAEFAATGVPCGIQDQTASVRGGVFLLDCRTRSVEPLALPHGTAVVIVDSGVSRTLAGSPWTERREESFAVARDLGLRVLRDATPEQVADQARGRHAVSEMARVREFAAAAKAGDAERLGALMLASHASSRDDMEVSIPALDTLVECLTSAGAFGARLTGGGFGGCCVALAPAGDAAAIGAAAAAEYAARSGHTPTAIVAVAAPGAGPLPRA
jgi:galactokinase